MYMHIYTHTCTCAGANSGQPVSYLSLNFDFLGWCLRAAAERMPPPLPPQHATHHARPSFPHIGAWRARRRAMADDEDYDDDDAAPEEEPLAGSGVRIPLSMGSLAGQSSSQFAEEDQAIRGGEVTLIVRDEAKEIHLQVGHFWPAHTCRWAVLRWPTQPSCRSVWWARRWSSSWPRSRRSLGPTHPWT